MHANINVQLTLRELPKIVKNGQDVNIEKGKWYYTLSQNYVSQSFSVIIQKLVYRRQFPFQAVITETPTT